MSPDSDFWKEPIVSPQERRTATALLQRVSKIAGLQKSVIVRKDGAVLSKVTDGISGVVAEVIAQANPQ